MQSWALSMLLKSHRWYYLIFWFTILIQWNIWKITVYHENMVFIAYIGQAHHKSHLESRPQAARLWPQSTQLCWTCTWCLLFMVHAGPNHRLKFSFQTRQPQQRRLYLILLLLPSNIAVALALKNEQKPSMCAHHCSEWYLRSNGFWSLCPWDMIVECQSCLFLSLANCLRWNFRRTSSRIFKGVDK